MEERTLFSGRVDWPVEPISANGTTLIAEEAKCLLRPGKTHLSPAGTETCPKVSITCLPLYLLGSHKNKWLTLSFSVLPVLTVLTDLFILYNLIFFLAFSQRYALEGHQTSLKYQIK